MHRKKLQFSKWHVNQLCLIEIMVNHCSSAPCPICNKSSEVLLQLYLSERGDLPRDVSLVLCKACDFAFMNPRDQQGYSNYYAAIVNDQLGERGILSPEELTRYENQFHLLSNILKSEKSLNVLDIGCGRGGLLSFLEKRSSKHSYFGSDSQAKDGCHVDSKITFIKSWKKLPLKFDLIILSHVLEHVVDFQFLREIKEILADDGVLYIEVPDASRYDEFKRREYLYYIDRLHINHFSLHSLDVLLNQYCFYSESSGLKEIQYKDDALYPACYAIYRTKVNSFSEKREGKKSITSSLQNYLLDESIRASNFSKKIPLDCNLIIYGFGDNFFRSRATGGPLSNYKLVGIVDRRWKELSSGEDGNDYRFMSLDEAVKLYGELTFIVTVSWGTETILRDLTASGVGRIIVL